MQKKILLTIALLAAFAAAMRAGDIKGSVRDASTGEPLIGATIQAGPTVGTVTDLDGLFTLSGLAGGTHTLTIQYVSYQTVVLEGIAAGGAPLDIRMEPETQALGDVTVVARKNMESENVLLQERQHHNIAIENIGAREMDVKGVSNVQEGVKKITGISIAEAGQLIVRGLGDRYSTTTLNGLPIASPNPDNKLIPLDLFPSSTVRNITVSKVYEAGAFADYSGAHIDIGTKENTGRDFFSLSFNVGGKFNTLFQDYRQMDRQHTLFRDPSMDRKALGLGTQDFRDYARSHDIFHTTFQVRGKTALPDFGGSAGGSKTWDFGGGHRLSLFASLGVSNEQQTMQDAFVKTLEAGGSTIREFDYDSYAAQLKIAGLANAGYSFRRADRISYTFFYARNAVDEYMDRTGFDYEGNHLRGSNNVTHIYALQNHQLAGHHEFGDRWRLDWAGSYGMTGSDEPDRRQVMFANVDGRLELFTLDQQQTMRYFGELDENELVADVRSTYKFGKEDMVRFGFTYKDKERDYTSTRFYYNLDNVNPDITSIYDTDPYLNYANVAAGLVTIARDQQPKDTYRAGNAIYAAFAETDWHFATDWLLNLGLRYEHSQQWVNYFNDGGRALRSELNSDDLFPALNLKYTLDGRSSFRFSFSRTVTRPSFIEMAPFLYQESYGASQIRGNDQLKNGYNYNFDLRYEFFSDKNTGDMVAATGYAKVLESPIERIQRFAGGSTLHSFQNASTGMAAGLEVEFRKELLPDLRLGANASFMYTNVKLPEGGSYTNTQRALQGASPFLINADLSYAPRFGEEKQLVLTLLYNAQGPRIHSVGIAGLGDVEQQTIHTLDFVASYKFNSRLSLRLQVKDMLNRDIVFEQDVPSTGATVEVERFKTGAGMELGVSYAF